jgi:asparagine synthase (glutamine-hydrolysing)
MTLFLIIFEYKLEHLLKWEDRNSMCFSIESRVPFLDHRLVEKTLSTPAHQIIQKGMTKFILRDALKKILPESIRLRKDKVGFSRPQDKWFRTRQFSEYIIPLSTSICPQSFGFGFARCRGKRKICDFTICFMVCRS